ncbi:unnamed protein product [Leptidea sinapis]|uniref:Uncharacterized protein n=1 Tax=Leptidea sinapis TaxID=189913 RepID=A0A5E4PNW5_9NEOP|nr:unnamed protein product [Leptidea sinapis]
MVPITLFHTQRGPTSRNLSIIAGGRAIAHQSVADPQNTSSTEFSKSASKDIETLNDVELVPLISPSENIFFHQLLTEPAFSTPVKQPPCTAFNGPPSTSSTFIDSNAQARKFISPLEFCGLPKADHRKGNRAARRKGKTMLATDTPEKDQI